jgi:hypothetical protein
MRHTLCPPRSRPRMTDQDSGGVEQLSLLGLIKRLPELLTRLVRDEIHAAQKEIGTKAKAAGLGAGLAAGGAVFSLFAVGALVTAAIAGLDVVVPHWAAGLIVAGALLAVAAVLVVAGVSKLKSGVPPLPTDTIAGVKEDIKTVRGTQ